MKLGPLKTKSFTATSPASLDAAITAFLATVAEADYVGCQFAATYDGTDVIYAAILLYVS